MRVAIVITFHQIQHNLKFRTQFLNTVLDNLEKLEYKKEIIVNTNEEGNYNYVGKLNHPYDLAWCHVETMSKFFKDETFTHFLYLEDDIVFTQKHIEYFLKYQKDLCGSNFFPGFIRFEEKDNQRYLTDFQCEVNINNLRRYKNFINFPHNHQAMYFMDRSMMQEYLSSDSSKRHGKHRHSGILESSAEGLLYTDVPKNFYSRNLIPYNSGSIDQNCFIHHVSNTYVNKPNLPLAKQNLNTILKL